MFISALRCARVGTILVACKFVYDRRKGRGGGKHESFCENLLRTWGSRGDLFVRSSDKGSSFTRSSVMSNLTRRNLDRDSSVMRQLGRKQLIKGLLRQWQLISGQFTTRLLNPALKLSLTFHSTSFVQIPHMLLFMLHSSHPIRRHPRTTPSHTHSRQLLLIMRIHLLGAFRVSEVKAVNKFLGVNWFSRRPLVRS